MLIIFSLFLHFPVIMGALRGFASTNNKMGAAKDTITCLDLKYRRQCLTLIR